MRSEHRSPHFVSPALILIVLLLGAPALTPSCSSLASDTEDRSIPKQSQLSETYGKLPLYFEANRGQTDPEVKFLVRGPQQTLFLTSTEAVMVVTKRDPPAGEPATHGKPKRRGPATGTVLRMTFAGANPTARVTGLEELTGRANYFIGNDPSKWQTNVPTYARVRYQELYPGIDLVYYGNQRQLEYDFIVHPGADPSAIALGFAGADKLEVDARGDLLVHMAAGEIRQRKPVIYQEVDGVRREIAGGYVLKGSHQVTFRVSAYDATRPLVIDPVLFYSTYLGGSGDDRGLDIAVDTAGNAYVTGLTSSLNFPTTVGASQTTRGGGSGDAYVAKLNPTGSALVYSTYLGGSDLDFGNKIVVDTAGNAYVTGLTASTNFPTTLGAFQTMLGGSFDAFVTKLNPAGSTLVYSTYLGGRTDDVGYGIAVDPAGNAYVTGSTDSANFPTTIGAFQTAFGGGARDAFVTKLNSTGSAIVYSTYLGGSDFDQGRSIALDLAANAYVTGLTTSTNFPTTTGTFQTSLGSFSGFFDAFVTKLNPTGAALVYSTYLGGANDDVGVGIAVDLVGTAYVTGYTGSTNFPTTTGAFQTIPGSSGGTFDAFVAKFTPTGSALAYSTYLGGSNSEQGVSIAVDLAGNAYVTGFTNSTNFPTTTGAFQTSLGGSGGLADAFVTKLNPTGAALVYSTYLGGSSNDAGAGIAVDALPNPNAYVTGYTASTDFPTTIGAYQTTYGGGGADAFVAKIVDVVLPPPPTVGKVTGGGSINVDGGIGTFGFIVQRQAADQSIQGDLQYVNHANGEKVHSVLITMFTIAGNTATFSGTCTNNGVPCSFIVNVADNGEPGTNDSFTITIDAGPPEGANENLRSGNIQIHQ